MPAHYKLEAFLDEYLSAAGIRYAGKSPLFCSAAGKTGMLTERPMDRVHVYEMVRRRTAATGFKVKLGCHVFRATGIADYLEAGRTLESAQAMAAHESRVPQNCTTAPATRPRSMRSSESRFRQSENEWSSYGGQDSVG
jgi:hypothetical protein